MASVERTVRGRGESSRSPMRRPLWVEDGSAWIKAGAMNWREVGRFGSYLWSRYTRHCWTLTEGKKEGYWYGQLLAFDPSHVTSFFIFARSQDMGTPSYAHFPGLGRLSNSWPAAVHVTHLWTKSSLTISFGGQGIEREGRN